MVNKEIIRINVETDVKPFGRGIEKAYLDSPKSIESAFIITKHIKPFWSFTQPFDKALEALAQKGFNIISLEECADLILKYDLAQKESLNVHLGELHCGDFPLKHATFVREGIIYIPNKGKFLTKKSPVIECPKAFTEAYNNSSDGLTKGFYLNEDQIENALADSVRVSHEEIPTKRFGDDPVTTYAFGKKVKILGAYLEEHGIKKMPIYLRDIEAMPFVNQVAIIGSNHEFGIYGDYNSLSHINIRGSKIVKDFETYTPKQISEALKSRGFSGLEKSLIASLRQKK